MLLLASVIHEQDDQSRDIQQCLVNEGTSHDSFVWLCLLLQIEIGLVN